MRWAWLILGVLAVLVGIVWTLQGLDVLKGSGMSGQPTGRNHLADRPPARDRD